jgi:hypothetical protein
MSGLKQGAKRKKLTKHWLNLRRVCVHGTQQQLHFQIACRHQLKLDGCERASEGARVCLLDKQRCVGMGSKSALNQKTQREKLFVPPPEHAVRVCMGKRFIAARHRSCLISSLPLFQFAYNFAKGFLIFPVPFGRAAAFCLGALRKRNLINAITKPIFT